MDNSYFANFCEQTTLHGWNYLGDRRLPVCRRMLWWVIVVTSFCVAAFFLQWFVLGFLQDTVSTTIETTTASLDNVHFPAVTICNANQFRRSFMSSLGIYTNRDLSIRFAQEFVIGTEIELSPEQKAEVEAVLHTKQFKQMAAAYYRQGLNLNESLLEYQLDRGLITLGQLVSRLAIQWEPGSMVMLASYQGLEQVLSVPTFFGTDHGICARVTAQTFDRAHEAPERPATVRRRMAAVPGVRNGINNAMSFVIDAEAYDYVDNRSASDGFKLALHHHLDVAVLRQQGFHIAPGKEAQISVTPVLHSTTSTARARFGPRDRNCYFQSEITLRHWPYNSVESLDPAQRSDGGRYSMGNCLLEAALQEIDKVCGCTPSFHMTGFNTTTHPPCRGTGIFCANTILDRMGAIDSIEAESSSDAYASSGRLRCRAACDDQVNAYDVSTLRYPNVVTFRLRSEVCMLLRSLSVRCAQAARRLVLDDVYPELCAEVERATGPASAVSGGPCSQDGLLKNFRASHRNANSTAPAARNSLQHLIDLLYRYARDNLALVHVFVRDPYVTKLKRDEAFSVILFVAGAGGLMGLCTGFSFLSGIEIVYHLGFAVSDVCADAATGTKNRPGSIAAEESVTMATLPVPPSPMVTTPTPMLVAGRRRRRMTTTTSASAAAIAEALLVNEAASVASRNGTARSFRV